MSVGVDSGANGS